MGFVKFLLASSLLRGDPGKDQTFVIPPPTPPPRPRAQVINISKKKKKPQWPSLFLIVCILFACLDFRFTTNEQSPCQYPSSVMLTAE